MQVFFFLHSFTCILIYLFVIQDSYMLTPRTPGSTLITSSPLTSRRSLDGPTPSIRYFGPTPQPSRFPGFGADSDQARVQI
jgi:hypothetical protein